MWNCIFCGKPTGSIFSRAHDSCRSKNEKARGEIIAMARSAAVGGYSPDISDNIAQIADGAYVTKDQIRSLMVRGWELAVEDARADHLLDDSEESNLRKFAKQFKLSGGELNKSGAWDAMEKGAILRRVISGDFPQCTQMTPFNLQKTETLVWVFNNVEYFEERTRTSYVGGSQGISIRVARGVYWRTGAFRGERVQTPETVHADTGILGITTKHVYFAGDSKRFRVPYKKIVAFEPFQDGIGIQKDAASARPQTFHIGDGWFAYNLIVNLAEHDK